MRKIIIATMALATIGATEVNAQGFLKKLKQKAEAAMGGAMGANAQQAAEDEAEYSSSAQAANSQDINVPQGSDIVPKRHTSTIIWDGVITPSTASTAVELMRQLPALPSAEKMARSSMEERDAYYQSIAAVTTRCEQLEKQGECSDAEMVALREKWEKKVSELFGITKEEMALLQDENATDAQKEPVKKKITAKILGGNPDMDEMERFGNMSEKEQEAYLRAHPEFMQKMRSMATNARKFTGNVQAMTAVMNGYESQMGRLSNQLTNLLRQEQKHTYANIGSRYEGKLRKLYDAACAASDQVSVDAYYDEADGLLYSYRLEAAKEYRASLQKQITETKRIYAEMIKLTEDMVQKGELPQCVATRMQVNSVIGIANILKKAYGEMPELVVKPFCSVVAYKLPKGWNFQAWECNGYAGGFGELVPGKTPDRGFGCDFPLLALKGNDDGTTEYGVVECDKFRQVSESEAIEIEKQAEVRIKQRKTGDKKPPYGVYKSKNGKRTIEYSRTGELIINGMSTYTPIMVTVTADTVEWLLVLEDQILKCTYKL